MTEPWWRSGRIAFGLASVLYLITALFVLRSVAPAPSTLLPYNSGIDRSSRQMGHFDQSMVVSVVARNAHILVTEPWNLLGDGQCYPFPKSFTLGEHMFGEGVLMAAPWALTHDPILAYNLMLVLTLWLPGITMYLLAHHFTRHAGASFVSGLLFLLTPNRIIDGGHPFLHAEFWLPLILLLLHRLFTSDRRWSCAAGIAVLLSLEALETVYVVLACGIIAGIYGLHLAIHYPHRLARVAAPLAASLAFALGVAWLVLGPYFDTRETWNVLAGRPAALFPLWVYGPGTPYFIGIPALILVVIGLGDRAVQRREIASEDPRLPMLIAGLVIIWASVGELPLPGTSASIPGLLLVLAQVVPGLDAVRGLLAVSIGLWTCVAFLAAYGVLVLTERVNATVTIAIILVISLAVFAERFGQSIAVWSFGTPLDLAAWDARPAEDDIELIRTSTQGPVLDVPMAPPSNPFARMALSRNLLLQSWAPLPSSSCYNSFDTPMASQIFQLSDALPGASAAEALAALGFETVLSHSEAWWPPHLVRWNARAKQAPSIDEIMPLRAESSGLSAYRLTPHAAVRTDLAMLGGRAQGPPVELVKEERTLVIPFVFHNAGPDTFRHPPPLAPSDAVLQWHRDGEALGEPERVRVLWPIALGAGHIMRVDVRSEMSHKPGTYHVTLRGTADQSLVIATRDVIIPAVAD